MILEVIYIIALFLSKVFADHAHFFCTALLQIHTITHLGGSQHNFTLPVVEKVLYSKYQYTAMYIYSIYTVCTVFYTVLYSVKRKRLEKSTKV